MTTLQSTMQGVPAPTGRSWRDGGFQGVTSAHGAATAPLGPSVGSKQRWRNLGERGMTQLSMT